MSDLHGCYNEFMLMLNQVNFSKNDTLYILGDIFDRGPNPIGILEYIMNSNNIHLIRGNHEEMFVEYFVHDNLNIWLCNGGSSTYKQLKEKGLEYEKKVYDYIKQLPYIKVIDNFILVHAGLHFPDNYNNLSLKDFLNQDAETCLWSRDNIGFEKQYKNYTIICGHTPVQTITNNYSEAKILKKNGTIYIDCGCCFKDNVNAALSCLRLDDLAEFYI